MNQKVYPRNWPTRNAIPHTQGQIEFQIVQEKARQSALGFSVVVYDLFVSWKKSSKIIEPMDCVRFFIKVANRSKLMLRAFIVGINNVRVQRRAHYHAIVGFFIPTSANPIHYRGLEKFIKGASNGEALKIDAKLHDPMQEPFNEIAYIVGKHNWTGFENPTFTPRKSQNIANH